MMTGQAASCKQVDKFLQDYLEGRLDEKTKLRFDEHIEMCKGCQEYLKQFRETLDALSLIEAPEVPDSLADLTLEFIRSKSS